MSSIFIVRALLEGNEGTAGGWDMNEGGRGNFAQKLGSPFTSDKIEGGRRRVTRRLGFPVAPLRTTGAIVLG